MIPAACQIEIETEGPDMYWQLQAIDIPIQEDT